MASTVTIQELDPNGNPSGRSLTLSGPGLPFMGAEWAMKNELKTTWYPGNSEEATQQILGPQELPSKWSGLWKRTQLGKQPQQYVDSNGTPYSLIDPMSMWNAMETIARAGQRLQVVWSVDDSSNDPTLSAKVTRQGRFAELKFKADRVTDVEWEIQLDWMSRGGQSARVTSTRSNTVTSNSAAYQNALNALILANQAASLQQFAPTSLTIGQLEAIANYPTKLVNSLARSVQQIESDVGSVVVLAATVASQPASVANRAIDLAQNSIDQANNFADTLGQVPFELMTTKQTVAALAQSINTFGPQWDAAIGMADAGQIFAAQLRAQATQAFGAGYVDPTQLGDPNQLLAIYVTHAGDTPAFISNLYYGNPDHGVDICRANGLSWYTPSFVAGQPLIIPTLPSVSASAAV